MSDERIELIRGCIRDVPDFPKEGILFKDITPLLSSPSAFGAVIDLLAERYAPAGLDAIVGLESRGFLFGTPLATRLGLPFVPARKPGKLPAESDRVVYELEYGTDALEMHVDALSEGDLVLIVDDLIATGGTASAAVALVERRGARVHECAFLIELAFLGGRAKLGAGAHSLLVYE